MRIGLLTDLKTMDMPFLARIGFESFELVIWPDAPYDPKKLTERDIAQFREQLATYKLELSCLGYYPNHFDRVREPGATEHFLSLLQLAPKLGVNTVCTFTGRDGEKSIADNMPMFKTYWTDMAKRAGDLGLKIGFENCPMFHTHPFRGTNIAFTPKAWELMFDAVPSPVIGLEWDPSHLICLQIAPVPTIRKFKDRIIHVHAKDAEVCWDVVREHGIFDEHAVNHRMPGLGQVCWREVISALIECGYTGNLDIEGAHDPVYGGKLEEAGLLVGLNTLRQYVPKTTR
jgi:sugar phosphate isomerase/epimerase